MSRPCQDIQGQLRDTAHLRKQQTPEEEEEQRVVKPSWVNHTDRSSFSWFYRCAETNLPWVTPRSKNVPSPPCSKQDGNPASSHQGKPLPRARRLLQSGGKFVFYSQSFSFTTDICYRSSSKE